MELRLIGLYGPSRAGKDETAAILVNDFGFEQRAQAAAIRKILLDLNPILQDNDGNFISMVELFERCDGNWDSVKQESRESVDYMIRLGQSCRNVIGYDVWMNTAMPSRLELEKGHKIVISDIRQPNEYEAVKERGGQVWKLVRPGVEFRAMDGLLEGYDFDATIENRGSLFDLRGAVQATIAHSIFNEGVKGAGYYGGNYGNDQ